MYLLRRLLSIAIFIISISYSEQYSCDVDPNYNGDPTTRNNFHFHGTSLGGWLVLEPWITPSLFYQFLGASEKWGDEAPKHVGLDSYTFCTALGDEEANKQLRRHWKTWVTEAQIKNIKYSGATTLRIPVGDWMYVPYEPYIGCMDGALDELNRVLKLCAKYGLTAVLDIHAMKGSQNGLDNSGDSDSLQWVSTVSTGGAAKYNHWDIRGADWIGHYNVTYRRYDSINYTNIEHGLKVVQTLVETHYKDPAVVGMTPGAYVSYSGHSVLSCYCPVVVVYDDFIIIFYIH
jgi:glucan 1,3-beta-glucosidase